jgi:hypothetical protein
MAQRKAHSVNEKNAWRYKEEDWYQNSFRGKSENNLY